MSFFNRSRRNRDKTDGSEAAPSWYHSLPGQLYDKWPKQDGKPERPIFLKHCTSVDMEDEMLIGLLSACSIPAVKLYPSNGSFGVLVLGMSAEGSDIYVPASMFDDASALIGGIAND